MVTRNKIWSMQYKNIRYADFAKQLSDEFKKSKESDFDKWLQRKYLEYCKYKAETPESEQLFLEYLSPAKDADGSDNAFGPVNAIRTDPQPPKISKTHFIIGGAIVIALAIIVYNTTKPKTA